ncbi:SDR family oxidoreductase [Aerococcaceae bacterium NML130460]|nr:SDR family oxidoreductase [Aerococcaceae bacterium NML130460]
MRLQGKVVMITGASSGIGREIARQAAAEGATLVLAARRFELLLQLASELKAQYDTATLCIATDLTNPQDIERLVAETMATYGRIDVLLSGAGYGLFKRATQFSYSEIQNIFSLNTFAMMYLAQLVAIEMIPQGSGQIVFIASIAGKIATPSSSIYSATKFAVIGYANALRLELQPVGIQVTTVNPGPVDTEFFEHDTTTKRYYQRVKPFSLRPEYVAKRVVGAMAQPKWRTPREINLPMLLNVASKLSTIFPKVSDYLTTNVFNFKEES